MTETNMITSNPYIGERKAGTVGRVLEDVEIRIADLDIEDEVKKICTANLNKKLEILKVSKF